MVGMGGDDVEVVADHDLGDAPAAAGIGGQVAAQAVAVGVQAGARLIQHQQVRLATEGLGQHHPLQFAAGQTAQGPLGQVVGADFGQQGPGPFPVGAGQPQEHGPVADGDGQGLFRRQGQGTVQGQALGHIAQALEPPGDGARVGQQAQQAAQQGRLSRTVGPDDGRTGGVGDPGGDVAEDRHLAPAGPDLLQGHRRRAGPGGLQKRYRGGHGSGMVGRGPRVQPRVRGAAPCRAMTYIANENDLQIH